MAGRHGHSRQQAAACHSRCNAGLPLRVKRARGGARNDGEGTREAPPGKTAAAAADRRHADGVEDAEHAYEAFITAHLIYGTVIWVRGGWVISLSGGGQVRSIIVPQLILHTAFRVRVLSVGPVGGGGQVVVHVAAMGPATLI